MQNTGEDVWALGIDSIVSGIGWNIGGLWQMPPPLGLGANGSLVVGGPEYSDFQLPSAAGLLKLMSGQVRGSFA